MKKMVMFLSLVAFSHADITSDAIHCHYGNSCLEEYGTLLKKCVIRIIKKHVTLYLKTIIKHEIQAMATTTHVKQVLAKCVMVVKL
ncbi:hypothetical protein LS77_009975 [Helicobacter bilis]|uniref:Uncharacterized protein n=2 Tax=Helicobacter bilis TaxID=37372 RepID=A0A6D2C6L9_9HELI|nr:hypothetical protein [Helicobacter bilis]EMZ36586.1 hypothetical protein C826_02390 [Helicobacter bilis WiWa]TLE02615.1 hypothetical protein LS77_009975 [Helicobacter bilis]TLE03691.1 hypothetical protein LS76_010045 [Helicobacter bilis]